MDDSPTVHIDARVGTRREWIAVCNSEVARLREIGADPQLIDEWLDERLRASSGPREGGYIILTAIVDG
ncbi:hypothetical protein [Euzebya rosea]|uniref:hypothetical protein n=1 Tax=Euzebya rosea TaxID=2052804 RepID=UPI000D3E2948|nr:hypothetical protein [Euzebya rosea]